jgi:hypothetical protein
MFKRISKIFLQFLVVSILIFGALHVSAAFAETAGTAKNLLPLPGSDVYGGVPAPPEGATGQDMVIAGVQKAVGYFKVLIGVVAVFFIIFMGAKLATAGGNEEEVKKATKGLLFSILALAIISLSEEIALIVGFFKEDAAYGGKSTGGLIGSPGQILERVHLFDIQVEVVITFIKYLIGSFAVLMVVINGVKLVVGGGEEENVKKAKNGIIYALAGLLMMYLADIAVNKVFYKLDKSIYSGLEGAAPATDLQRGLGELIGITNFVVSFVGPLLLLVILIGGVLYMTAAGEEEKMNKAKRVIISGAIGLIVVYGAFALISTVITGYFAPETINIE